MGMRSPALLRTLAVVTCGAVATSACSDDGVRTSRGDVSPSTSIVRPTTFSEVHCTDTGPSGSTGLCTYLLTLDAAAFTVSCAPVNPDFVGTVIATGTFRSAQREVREVLGYETSRVYAIDFRPEACPAEPNRPKYSFVFSPFVPVNPAVETVLCVAGIPGRSVAECPTLPSTTVR